MSNNPSDITPSVNDIIKNGRKAKIINSKEIKPDYHTTGQLYRRVRTCFRFASIHCPRLMFISLKHYDEDNDSITNFNDDFIVGVFTPVGPATFHFKMEFYDEFKHLPYYKSSPLYDGYQEDEMMDRIDILVDMLLCGKTEEELIEEINNDPTLHESQKPKQLIK